MEGGWFDSDAIEAERFDADMEMASLEAQGARMHAKKQKSQALRATDPAASAAMCPHGGGYPLDSPAATNDGDPNAGEEGVRCWDCGSRLSDWAWDGGKVLVPCEIEGKS
jgi:hypothetical protein